MLDRIFLSNSYSYRKKKCAAVIVFIAIYLLIPTIVTLNVTGVVYTPVNEDYSDGRKVIVKYRNATQEVGVDRFVAMVLAKRLYMSSEVEVLMELINGKYSKEVPEMFRDIYNSLLNTQEGRRADTYFILKDFCSYADAQKKIDERYRDEKSWAKTVMINSFKAGKFSSDRTIEEYATEIWKLTKTPVKVQY